MTWVILIAGIVFLILFWGVIFEWHIKNLRQNGSYPDPGEASDHDVHCLYRHGYRLAAYRLFCELHDNGKKTSLRQFRAVISGNPMD